MDQIHPNSAAEIRRWANLGRELCELRIEQPRDWRAARTIIERLGRS